MGAKVKYQNLKITSENKKRRMTDRPNVTNCGRGGSSKMGPTRLEVQLREAIFVLGLVC